MPFLSKYLYYDKVRAYKIKFGYNLKDPVFIVGCGHSGTSILLSILSNSHLFYTITSESYVFHKNEILRSKVLRLWVHNAYSGNKLFILEKTPSHCLKIKDILNTFISPKIIAIVRDGRDVALSIKKRTGNFEQGIERWVNDNNAITQSLSSKHVHIINYENFVSSPVNTINNLSDFLGETLNKRILNNIEFGRKNFYNEKSDNSSHGHRRNEQINQNLIDYSGLWKRGLSNNEKNLFSNNTKAMKLMFMLGYEDF